MIRNIQDIKNIFIENIHKGKLMDWKGLEMFLDDYEYSQDELSQLKTWYYSVAEFSFLDSLCNLTEEVIIHSPERVQLIQSKKRSITTLNMNQEDYELSLTILALKNSCDWNFSCPFVSFNYKSNYRVTLIHHATSPKGISKAFFRKHRTQEIAIDDFGISAHHELISEYKNFKNVIVCGATGSGKTTFLNALASYIDAKEHIVIIEDTHEIKMHQPFVSYMLASNHANKKMNDYLAYAMRMSPDRLVLGEIRSNEVIPFMLALNTGHNGSLTTIHANSATDAIHRIALLYSIYGEGNLEYSLILKLITSNIDYVVFLKDKRVQQISKIYGSDKDSILHENMLNYSKEIVAGF
jgi:type IV secretion system protein VirB11